MTNLTKTDLAKLTHYGHAWVEESGAWECGPYKVIMKSKEHPGAIGVIVAQGEIELCDFIADALNNRPGLHCPL